MFCNRLQIEILLLLFLTIFFLMLLLGLIWGGELIPCVLAVCKQSLEFQAQGIGCNFTLKDSVNSDVLTPFRIIVIKKTPGSEEVHKYVTDDFTLRKK